MPWPLSPENCSLSHKNFITVFESASTTRPEDFPTPPRDGSRLSLQGEVVRQHNRDQRLRLVAFCGENGFRIGTGNFATAIQPKRLTSALRAPPAHCRFAHASSVFCPTSLPTRALGALRDLTNKRPFRELRSKRRHVVYFSLTCLPPAIDLGVESDAYAIEGKR
jgi:hypothetical protein